MARQIKTLFLIGIMIGSGLGFAFSNQKANIYNPQNDKSTNMKALETATLGGGCFWCVEAIYEQLDGVEAVRSGYAGGMIENPTYKEVCSGLSGHAEVVQIDFDSGKVSYGEILEVFWRSHDPTTLNRQGNDVGTQYRSVIYYHDEAQQKAAIASMQAADEAGLYEQPIVTEISALPIFYAAEDYHQNYYENNPNQSYCTYVVGPKVEKFKKLFKDKLKK